MDRQQRFLGLVRSAERDLERLDSASTDMKLLAAYADGVNAWIDGMRARDVPFEYRILGVRPMRWEPLYTLYLLKRMGYMLSYSTHDQVRRRVELLVGRAAGDALFPINSPIQQPIQPSDRTEPRFDFAPLPEPQRQGSAQEMVVAGEGRWGTVEDGGGSPSPSLTVPHQLSSTGGAGEVGSNNWAVAPSRSATGHTMLAGDPHLELTLPAIWYEVHLVVPGEMDVYGVTIPGVPAVIIGFNRNVAWSFTNAEADVVDYYREVLDNDEQPTEYHVDGEWLPLEQRIEQYHGRKGEVLVEDTVYFTHRGPLVQGDHARLSMRWTVLEGTGATAEFFDVGRAASVTEWLAATESYVAPAQTGAVADREGNIAIRSTGHFPIRAGDGKGTTIRAGVVSQHDWQGFWDVGTYPFAINPEQGFLASANQQPIDPTVDARYLGVNWIAPWRAMQINALLRADSSVTAEEMRQMQTHPGSPRADLFVAAFLAAAERVLAAANDSGLERAGRLLAEWDRNYTKDNERAILFEYAMQELVTRTWDELETPSGERVATPSQATLLQLLEYPESVWWDIVATEDMVETRDVILSASLTAALDRTTGELGQPNEGGWRWSHVRRANIYHLLGFPSLSALDLPVQGGPSTLNPSSGAGTHGASWRMVVELGPRVRAWATYPGGQSGNPASSRYDDRIQQWTDGEFDEVLYPHSEADLPTSDVLAVLTLQPGRN
jgi:penicillin amidase